MGKGAGKGEGRGGCGFLEVGVVQASGNVKHPPGSCHRAHAHRIRCFQFRAPYCGRIIVYRPWCRVQLCSETPELVQTARICRHAL